MYSAQLFSFPGGFWVGILTRSCVNLINKSMSKLSNVCIFILFFIPLEPVFKSFVQVYPKIFEISPHPHFSPGGCVVMSFRSLRATAGSVAISEISMPCEIASVASLPRNDITTQSLDGGGRRRGGMGSVTPHLNPPPQGGRMYFWAIF